ncbi:hypothetical protein K438DRAFT_1801019 [Mycena galopus ATCC 62051]|nr:hypothetical protein K438DRAFT_1801019 [Mycena galopus ATCC 62051]
MLYSTFREKISIRTSKPLIRHLTYNLRTRFGQLKGGLHKEHNQITLSNILKRYAEDIYNNRCIFVASTSRILSNAFKILSQ